MQPKKLRSLSLTVKPEASFFVYRAGKMGPKSTISLELQDISPAVANLEKGNPYRLPDGYFDALPEEILAKAKMESLLNGAKSIVYTAPNGYFNHLAEDILKKAKSGNSSPNMAWLELENIAPLLNTISRENVYSLPTNYFEGLDIAVPVQQKAKIIGFSKWRKLINYAAAAVFVGVLGVGGIKYMQSSSSSKSFNALLEKASDDELKQELDAHASATYSSIGTLADEQEEYSIFEGTPEEELQQYLKEQPETVEKANSGI